MWLQLSVDGRISISVSEAKTKNNQLKNQTSCITYMCYQFSGYLQSRCQDSITILGFVEVSLSCPADKAGYRPPTEHPMVQIMQRHLDEKNFSISYDEYKNNLTVSVSLRWNSSLANWLVQEIHCDCYVAASSYLWKCSGACYVWRFDGAIASQRMDLLPMWLSNTQNI